MVDARTDRENGKKLREYWKILLVVLVVFAALVAVYILTKPDLEASTSACSPNTMVVSEAGVQLSSASKKTYDLEFARTPPQEELGLSGRPCLPDNGALLFLFPTDDRFSIWMKDMLFPIDVIWLDSGKKIIKIEKNMQPSSYPKTYTPDTPARFVIELNKGATDTLHAQVGSQLNW